MVSVGGYEPACTPTVLLRQDTYTAWAHCLPRLATVATTQEDLRLIYAHTKRGGTLAKAGGGPYVVYRMHATNMSFGVPDNLIHEVRVRAFETQWLQCGVHGAEPDPLWHNGAPFSIWNAGKEGKRLFKKLSQANRDRVKCFGDIDEKKIGKTYHHRELKVPSQSAWGLGFSGAQATRLAALCPVGRCRW